MESDFLVELEAALEAATRAGDYLRCEYEVFTPIPDAPADISTEMDRASQEMILQFLQSRFPDDGFCAEENTQSKSHGTMPRRVWVIDPIDGTRGFARKNGEFSVMIGMTLNHAPAVGVVLEPVTMRCTFAALNRGCWTRIGNEEPIRCRVRSETDITRGILIQSRTSRESMPVQKLKPGTVMEMYSAGVKLAVVARGEADVYANTYGAFADWDICAGHILVTEAGGCVTGLGGEKITYGHAGFRQNKGLIAANAAIHASIVASLL